MQYRVGVLDKETAEWLLQMVEQLRLRRPDIANRITPDSVVTALIQRWREEEDDPGRPGT